MYYVMIIMPITGLLGIVHELTDMKEFRIKNSIIQKSEILLFILSFYTVSSKGVNGRIVTTGASGIVTG